jgi:phosphohistidine phosphatase
MRFHYIFAAGLVSEKPAARNRAKFKKRIRDLCRGCGRKAGNMKQLMLMRHAKSSWKDASLPDHDRPLNRRGRDNAPQMGRFVALQHCLPAIILSSTAKRALQTAAAFVKGCGQNIPVVPDPALYHADVPDYCESVATQAGLEPRIMVISHNPGLEEWLWQLTNRYERLPTAAIAIVEFREPFQWTEIGGRQADQLAEVWRPKEVL